MRRPGTGTAGTVASALLLLPMACDSPTSPPDLGAFSLEVRGARTADFEGTATFALDSNFWSLMLNAPAPQSDQFVISLGGGMLPSEGTLSMDPEFFLVSGSASLLLEGAIFFGRVGTLDISRSDDERVSGSFEITLVGGDSILVSQDTVEAAGTFDATRID